MKGMKEEIFVKPLPYVRDSTILFQSIAHLPYAVFLDSGQPYSMQGRFDILTASPQTLLINRGRTTEVHQQDNVTKQHDVHPFAVVRQHLRHIPSFHGYPFLGGAIGYFAYDLARRFVKLPEPADTHSVLPEMVVGIYDWAVLVDHAAMRSALVGLRPTAKHNNNWQEIYTLLMKTDSIPSTESFRLQGDLSSNMSKAEYMRKFDKIIRYIHAGDCYQINLAQKFTASVSGDSFAAYCQLRKISAAPFSAYMDCHDFQILSCSPERFLQVHAKHVTTKPIKGTRRCLSDAILNQYQIDQLRNSVKDRAENLMIVDLLRNDIGKSCRFSSVQVSNLFGLESFSNVHHLVSTIEGELCADKDVFDLLLGCFPGGSITGAPKRRAMEIINELEPERRNIYCGSIGYISGHGDMDLNIAIRTAVRQGTQFSFYAGGGIVADSDGESEYQETLDKVSQFFSLLNVQQYVDKQ